MVERTFSPTADDYTRAHDSLQFLLGAVEADALARRRPVTADADTALPVVVVAGFLGAGKTTLLAHLLARPGGRRITALVNDMAALDIDAGLIAESHGDTLSLTNGCACCSQSGGATRALLDVLARPERPDLVLLEASGVADPWALAQIVGGLPGLRLDHVVTLVDATGLATPAPSPYLAARQLAAADLVLLNKIDLLDPAEIEPMTEALRRRTPRGEVVRVTRAAVPPWLVLDGTERGEIQTTPPPGEVDTAFAHRVFRAHGPLDQTRLEATLATLPPGILRAKGFLRCGTDDYRLLQLVGRRWTWEEAPAPEVARDRLVVIGLAAAMDEPGLMLHLAVAGLVD